MRRFPEEIIQNWLLKEEFSKKTISTRVEVKVCQEKIDVIKGTGDLKGKNYTCIA